MTRLETQIYTLRYLHQYTKQLYERLKARDITLKWIGRVTQNEDD
ncbi:MAG: hypothetical protein R2880_03550 [Deinococcales bacterium]